MEEEIIVIEPKEEVELVFIEEDIEFIEPNTQEIIINPSFEQIIKTPNESFTGFSKVIVEPIPNDYIIPNGEINITENGSYDVIKLAVANVNVPEKTLGTKIINANGTYNALDDGIDGYSSVEVATSGVDINDYFVSSTSSSITSMIKKLPVFEFTGTSMRSFASNMRVLEEFPLIDTSKVTDMYQMFYYCSALKNVPLLNTSKVTNMEYMFQYSGIEELPQFDMSEVISLNTFCRECGSLKYVPSLNTNKVTNFNRAFSYLSKLISIGELDGSSALNVTEIINGLRYAKLTTFKDFGGIKDLGKAYLTTTNANYSQYKLDLSYCTGLTEQSLINVLTKVYDIKTKGCNAQQIVLGSTNLAKLTSEAGQQALANAQAKGWTIS